jgi:hypothetical protein
VRFSNGATNAQGDSKPDARGIALKVMGVPGTSILPQAATTQDFLMINSPIQPAADAAQFIGFGKAMADAAAASGVEDVIEALLRTGAYLTRPENARTCAFVKSQIKNKVFNSFVGNQFWSGGAIALGVDPNAPDPLHAHASQAIKFSVVTGVVQGNSCVQVSTGPGSGDNYLQADLLDKMKHNSVCLDFRIQFQQDPTQQLIEDLTVQWKESDTPFTSVAFITLPQDPNLPDADATARDEFCNTLAFSPWHTLPEHRPLGNMMRVRRFAYPQSAGDRGAATEPTGKEFPLPSGG